MHAPRACKVALFNVRTYCASKDFFTMTSDHESSSLANDSRSFRSDGEEIKDRRIRGSDWTSAIALTRHTNWHLDIAKPTSFR